MIKNIIEIKYNQSKNDKVSMIINCLFRKKKIIPFVFFKKINPN